MTQKQLIFIRDIDKLKTFVQLANCCNGDVICSKGKFVVDGKSLLGLISIDTSTGVLIEYPVDFVEMTEFVKTLC